MIGKNFISNLEKKDKYTLIKAAQATNSRIHIEDVAYNGNGLPVKNCVGIYAIDEKFDFTPMWIAFNEMKDGTYQYKSA